MTQRTIYNYMTQHNFVSIRGRLTADPVKKELENSELTTFTIANNRDYYNSSTKEKKEEVFFFDCKGFGNIAKLTNQYLKKGRDVLVTGTVRQDRWEDKETGEKRSKIVIYMDNFEFLDSVSKDTQSQDEGKTEKEREEAPPQPKTKKRPF